MDAPVRLFWTAGYDSTFRLLELLAEGAEVQPIYVIDRARASTSAEIAHMASLRGLMLPRWPGARLRPVEIRLRDDFPVAPDIAAAHAALAGQAHVGTQYAWLAQVCRDLGLAGVEMSIPRHEPPSALQRAVWDDPHGEAPRLKTDAARTVFGGFRFPVLGRTKADMGRAAEAAGFADVLARTWFCHRPVLGKPCGRCAPCRIARAERTGISYSRWGRARDLALRLRRRLGA